MSKRWQVLAALACLAAGCGTRPGPPDLTACVPPGSVAIAGIDLDRVRSAPVYAKLSAGLHSFADTYRDAHRMLLAWTGDGLLIVVRGTAPGSTAIAPHLAATGPAQSIHAAAAQYRTGKPGAPELVDYGKRTSAQSPIWAAVEGGVTLPLTGNARNLNRLLRNLQYAALAVDLTASLDLRVTALGRDEASTQSFEESLRAFLTLAAAEARNPNLASALASVQINRNSKTATATLRLPPQTLDTLLQPLTHPF